MSIWTKTRLTDRLTKLSGEKKNNLCLIAKCKGCTYNFTVYKGLYCGRWLDLGEFRLELYLMKEQANDNV